MSENCNPTFDIKGYLPNGFFVYLRNIPLTDYLNPVPEMLAYTNAQISAGFSLDVPGMERLEPGEKREKINGILRRKDQHNQDDTYSPTFDLYPDNPALGRRQVIINLDNPDEVNGFEQATGYKVGDFKIYHGSQLNRIEEPNDYRDYAKPINGSLHIVYKDNPAYDPNASKKKRQYLFVRWETATATPTPTPPPAPVVSEKHAQPEPELDRAAWETNEREKAKTALDNELVTIFRTRYTPTKNGLGVACWEATARVIDGASVPVVLWEPDVRKIKEAGYEWPIPDGDNLDIPITTKNVKGKRGFASVMPKQAENTPKANVGANNGTPDEYKPDWTVIYSEVKGLYADTKHMGNSVQALYREGAFKNCRTDADAINVIIDHKNGAAEGKPA